MLVLTRKVREEILIGPDIRIVLVSIKGQQATATSRSVTLRPR